MKEACDMLAFRGQDIEYKRWGVMLQLNKVLVSPQLGYYLQYSSPHNWVDLTALDRVWRRFSYGESLDSLGLFILE